MFGAGKQLVIGVQYLQLFEPSFASGPLEDEARSEPNPRKSLSSIHLTTVPSIERAHFLQALLPDVMCRSRQLVNQFANECHGGEVWQYRPRC
jgi:hypothetical protein